MFFQKPCYREIRAMRGRVMRGPPVVHLDSWISKLMWIPVVYRKLCLKLFQMHCDPDCIVFAADFCRLHLESTLKFKLR